MAYEDAKEHAGQSYRGMNVGGVHQWTYPDGKWTERKVTPQRWDVAFTSLKRRRRNAPDGSGAEVGSGYHWLVVAHQWVGKLDANTYATHLEGSKHLLAFRKPGWQGWTTQQRGHTSARLKAIAALEELIEELRDLDDGAFEDPKDDAALASLLQAEETGRAARTPAPASGQAPSAASAASTRRPPSAPTAATGGAKHARPARVRRERRERRAPRRAGAAAAPARRGPRTSRR